MSEQISENAADLALVKAFVSDHDIDALEQLLEKHRNRIFTHAFRVTRNRSDALDVTQEVFITVYKKSSSFRGASSFDTWLYRLTTNACYDLLRKRARQPVASAEIPEGSGRVDDEIARVDDRLAVEAALASLSPEHRAALVMRELEDMTYEQIAEVLEVPVGTVKSRIARGRAALADLVTEHQSQPGRQRDE
ncbi:MAG TPA: sigma-70 family RNA polymerase sigma factor [Actinomycetota bacterium]|nr:sigma-70 family RNA polymerase sigma factor [Actinomycetota bacterium]